MKTLPLISVVVPCYNAEKYLHNSLTSLRYQTYPNLQIITVDDRSSDNTRNILDCNAKHYRNFEVYPCRGKGVSAARNTGIEKAKGEYITFLDCDDIISPYHVENLYNLIKAGNADLAITSFKRARKNSEYEKFKFKRPKNNRAFTLDKTETAKYLLAQKKLDFCVWNKLYKTEILHKNGIEFLETCRFNEDAYFNYIYIKHIEKSVYTPAITHYYVQTKNSLVRQEFTEARLDAYISLNGIIKDAYENFDEIKDYSHATRILMSCYILFTIKLSKYENYRSINKIIEYVTEDVKHLKACKHVAKYRRILLPLLPGAAKSLLRKRLKPKTRADYFLPHAFED